MDYTATVTSSEKEYLEKRVNDQIRWVDEKSVSNKKWFLSLKVTEIIVALFIPFLTAYITDTGSILKIIVGLLGIIIAAITGIITLLKFQENWIEYRTLSESLKLEKFTFLAKTGIYQNQENAFPNFVERFESLISNSTKNWLDYTLKKDNEKVNDADSK